MEELLAEAEAAGEAFIVKLKAVEAVIEADVAGAITSAEHYAKDAIAYIKSVGIKPAQVDTEENKAQIAEDEH